MVLVHLSFVNILLGLQTAVGLKFTSSDNALSHSDSSSGWEQRWLGVDSCPAFKSTLVKEKRGNTMLFGGVF